MILQPWAGTARAAQTASAVRSSARGHRAEDPGSLENRAGRPLIVHADDFGETLEITRGIRLAIEAGVLTSTSIMANMPGTQDALQQVAGLADRASFGVHLNLCEGRPLTPARSLVDPEGRFCSKRALAARSVTGALVLADVEREIAAQIGFVHN